MRNVRHDHTRCEQIGSKDTQTSLINQTSHVFSATPLFHSPETAKSQIPLSLVSHATFQTIAY